MEVRSNLAFTDANQLIHRVARVGFDSCGLVAGPFTTSSLSSKPRQQEACLKPEADYHSTSGEWGRPMRQILTPKVAGWVDQTPTTPMAT